MLINGRLVPSNLFLNKIGLPAIYLPTVMIVWGIISGATAATQSFGGLLAVRFFLGFVEAAYFVRSLAPALPCNTLTLLPAGLSLLPLFVVHSQGTRLPLSNPLLWVTHIRCFLRLDRSRYNERYGRRTRPASVAVALHH